MSNKIQCNDVTVKMLLLKMFGGGPDTASSEMQSVPPARSDLRPQSVPQQFTVNTNQEVHSLQLSSENRNINTMPKHPEVQQKAVTPALNLSMQESQELDGLQLLFDETEKKVQDLKAELEEELKSKDRLEKKTLLYETMHKQDKSSYAKLNVTITTRHKRIATLGLLSDCDACKLTQWTIMLKTGNITSLQPVVPIKPAAESSKNTPSQDHVTKEMAQAEDTAQEQRALTGSQLAETSHDTPESDEVIMPIEVDNGIVQTKNSSCGTISTQGEAPEQETAAPEVEEQSQEIAQEPVLFSDYSYPKTAWEAMSADNADTWKLDDEGASCEMYSLFLQDMPTSDFVREIRGFQSEICPEQTTNENDSRKTEDSAEHNEVRLETDCIDKELDVRESHLALEARFAHVACLGDSLEEHNANKTQDCADGPTISTKETKTQPTKIVLPQAGHAEMEVDKCGYEEPATTFTDEQANSIPNTPESCNETLFADQEDIQDYESGGLNHETCLVEPDLPPSDCAKPAETAADLSEERVLELIGYLSESESDETNDGESEKEASDAEAVEGEMRKSKEVPECNTLPEPQPTVAAEEEDQIDGWVKETTMVENAEQNEEELTAGEIVGEELEALISHLAKDLRIDDDLTNLLSFDVFGADTQKTVLYSPIQDQNKAPPDIEAKNAESEVETPTNAAEKPVALISDACIISFNSLEINKTTLSAEEVGMQAVDTEQSIGEINPAQQITGALEGELEHGQDHTGKERHSGEQKKEEDTASSVNDVEAHSSAGNEGKDLDDALVSYLAKDTRLAKLVNYLCCNASTTEHEKQKDGHALMPSFLNEAEASPEDELQHVNDSFSQDFDEDVTAKTHDEECLSIDGYSISEAAEDNVSDDEVAEYEDFNRTETPAADVNEQAASESGNNKSPCAPSKSPTQFEEGELLSEDEFLQSEEFSHASIDERNVRTDEDFSEKAAVDIEEGEAQASEDESENEGEVEPGSACLVSDAEAQSTAENEGKDLVALDSHLVRESSLAGNQHEKEKEAHELMPSSLIVTSPEEELHPITAGVSQESVDVKAVKAKNQDEEALVNDRCCIPETAEESSSDGGLDESEAFSSTETPISDVIEQAVFSTASNSGNKKSTNKPEVELEEGELLSEDECSVDSIGEQNLKIGVEVPEKEANASAAFRDADAKDEMEEGEFWSEDDDLSQSDTLTCDSSDEETLTIVEDVIENEATDVEDGEVEQGQDNTENEQKNEEDTVNPVKDVEVTAGNERKDLERIVSNTVIDTRPAELDNYLCSDASSTEKETHKDTHALIPSSLVETDAPPDEELQSENAGLSQDFDENGIANIRDEEALSIGGYIIPKTAEKTLSDGELDESTEAFEGTKTPALDVTEQVVINGVLEAAEKKSSDKSPIESEEGKVLNESEFYHLVEFWDYSTDEENLNFAEEVPTDIEDGETNDGQEESGGIGKHSTEGEKELDSSSCEHAQANSEGKESEELICHLATDTDHAELANVTGSALANESQEKAEGSILKGVAKQIQDESESESHTAEGEKDEDSASSAKNVEVQPVSGGGESEQLVRHLSSQTEAAKLANIRSSALTAEKEAQKIPEELTFEPLIEKESIPATEVESVDEANIAPPVKKRMRRKRRAPAPKIPSKKSKVLGTWEYPLSVERGLAAFWGSMKGQIPPECSAVKFVAVAVHDADPNAGGGLEPKMKLKDKSLKRKKVPKTKRSPGLAKMPRLNTALHGMTITNLSE